MTAKAARYIMARKSAELDFVVEAVCQKFMEHQPTCRMERRVRNSNVNLARQTIGRHIITLGDYFEAVANEITAHVMSGPVVHFDETPLSSQKPGIGKLQSGFIWAACRDDRKWDPETKPAVCYHFDLSRSGDVPEQMLEGGSVEVLITDGHSGCVSACKIDPHSGVIGVQF